MTVCAPFFSTLPPSAPFVIHAHVEAVRGWRAVKGLRTLARSRTKWNWYVCKSLVSLCMRSGNVAYPRAKNARRYMRRLVRVARLCSLAALFAGKQANYHTAEMSLHRLRHIDDREWKMKVFPARSFYFRSLARSDDLARDKSFIKVLQEYLEDFFSLQRDKKSKLIFSRDEKFCFFSILHSDSTRMAHLIYSIYTHAWHTLMFLFFPRRYVIASCGCFAYSTLRIKDTGEWFITQSQCNSIRSAWHAASMQAFAELPRGYYPSRDCRCY